MHVVFPRYEKADKERLVSCEKWWSATQSGKTFADAHFLTYPLAAKLRRSVCDSSCVDSALSVARHGTFDNFAREPDFMCTTYCTVVLQ
jgi:hypothetical protein